MEAHLDARGIPHTPAAPAVAALDTQPPKQEWKLLERHEAWKRESAEQVRQWDQRQAPAVPRADGQARVRADAPKAAATPPRPDPAAQAQNQGGQVMGPAGPGQFVLSNQRPGPKAQPQQGQGAAVAEGEDGPGPATETRAPTGAGQRRGPSTSREEQNAKQNAQQGQQQAQGQRRATGPGAGVRDAAGPGPTPGPARAEGPLGQARRRTRQGGRLQARVVKEAWKSYRAKGEPGPP